MLGVINLPMHAMVACRAPMLRQDTIFQSVCAALCFTICTQNDRHVAFFLCFCFCFRESKYLLVGSAVALVPRPPIYCTY